MSDNVSRRSVLGGALGGAVGMAAGLTAASSISAPAARADGQPSAYDSTFGNYVLSTAPADLGPDFVVVPAP